MTCANVPTSITFRGMDVSEALRGKIEARARRLHRFADDIEACNVVVSASARSRHHGNRYNVRASVTMHGREIEAGHACASNPGQEDPCVAVAHTFDGLRRRIEDHVRRRRGDVKLHADSQRTARHFDAQPQKKPPSPIATAASTHRGTQLTAILRALPFACLGSLSVSTPLS